MNGKDDLAARRAQLSAAKQALLEKRLQGKVKKTTKTQTIPKRSEEGPAPLSYAQQRLWFFDQMEPGSSAYNLYGATRLVGSLNLEALEQSVNEIVRRHESLRTTFAEGDGQPVQMIAPELKVTLPVVDLQTLPKSEQEREIERITTENVKQPFDLSKGHLFRVILVKLAQEEHLIFTTMHHIISDDWSVGVLMGELAMLYAAFSYGKPSPLPELPIQYTDFAQWQRSWLDGDVLDRQLSYWKQQLSGAPSMLELPTDHPRPAHQTFQGKTYVFEISPSIATSLTSLSQKENCTLFMTLLAAFNVLLYRYTREEDIVIGSPFANRNRREIEKLIGFFVNTVVLRTDLSGNPTFRELLQRVRQMTIAAQENQDIPFDHIVAELHPKRKLSVNPIFQVMFTLENAPVEEFELPGLTFTTLDLEYGTSLFDLSLILMEEPDHSISGGLVYSTDLFEHATIVRMMEHFKILLDGIIINPDQRISQLPILPELERHQLLNAWNNPQLKCSEKKCLHQLIEAQVERTPEAVAVVLDEQHLTYRELNAQANQLANHLQSLGVKPERSVGLCVKRSLDMIIALLGILKAGGTYVPMDTTDPRERLEFILEDAEVQILVTHEALLEKFPEDVPHVICLDTDWETISQTSPTNPMPLVIPENSACILYTSGSTGIPKGAMIPHQSLVNFTETAIREYEITARDRILQYASIGFDAAAEEIYTCLSCGGTLVLLPEGQKLITIELFLQQCREREITVLDLPTAYWHVMVTELAINASLKLPKTVRLVIIGGERALPERVNLWQTTVGDYPRLVNTYGPTEATVVATRYNVSGTTRFYDVPIGRPLRHVQVYLLDTHLQPVPIGVPGELCIGGAALARGYLKRPDLTSEKFIADPYSNQSGARLYRTGDLARYRPDGNIEFLGRIDHQVKVRGLRVELGEIEAALIKHPAIREVAVTMQADVLQNNRLVAYIVYHQEQMLAISELRDLLGHQLPSYMIPSVFVTLDTMPLTTSGKVNRRALPDPDAGQFEVEGEFVAPRNHTETVLAEVWADVLRLDRVGIYDNFFELGGDSILCIQIINKMNQKGLLASPPQLLQKQTIAELAPVVTTGTATQTVQTILTGSVPLTPVQHDFFALHLSDPHHWNLAILLEVDVPLEPEFVEKTIQHLIKHHDTLRLRFFQEGSGWKQIYSDFGENQSVPFAVIDLSHLSETAQVKAIEEETARLQRSLNLAEGPLLQTAFFRLGEMRSDRLFIVIHHLAVDAVSWRILFEDLHTAYEQISNGTPIQLPPKTTSFKQWTEQLTEYAQSTALQAEIPYWLDEARKKVVRLPRDYPEGENTESSSSMVFFSLNPQLTRQLLREVPRAYNTQIKDVLLTALTYTFTQWTGNPQLLIDLEGHGREQLFENVDLSRTVGWFTTVVPVLLELQQISYPEDALMAIKDQLRRIPNNGIGFGLLRYLHRDKQISEQIKTLPQAEVSFNYLGQMDQIIYKFSHFREAGETIGASRSPREKREYVFEITGIVLENQFQINLLYSENMYRRTTVETLAKNFQDALEHIITP